MQLLEHYRRLAGYDGWANQEVIRSLRDMADPPARSVRWVAHILAAEYVWLSRLHSEVSPLPVWPELSLPQCHEQAKKLLAGWTGYLDSSPQLGAVIHYKNSKGESWANTVADILTHVFMHSAYHRGQIAADVRQSGHTPAYTDFIHGVRQKLVG
jgi:uncharacterized damage-inducible protein DinB